MLKFLMLPCAVWVVGSAVAPAAAQTTALNVRTGLWEVSSTRSSAGMPKMPSVSQIPPQVLAQMPPEQRARIESAMKAARDQASGTHVTRFCVTRDALQRGLSFGAETQPTCKQTIEKHSSTRWEMQQMCREGGGQQTIHVRYEAPKPDIMNGTVEIVMSNGGQKMSMKQVMRGRWLGPDCGDVKPE